MFLLLAGCAGDRPEGSTLDVTVVGQDAAQPAVAGPLARRLADELTATTLIERDDAGQLVGGLASSWRFVDSGQSLILRLRPVKWSDDKPLVANDVVASFQKAAAPPLRQPAFRLAGLAGAEAVAAGRSVRQLGVMAPISRVVEFRLNAASPLLLEWLAEPAMSVRRAGAPTLSRYTRQKQADDAQPASDGNTTVLQRRSMDPSPESRPAEVRIHSRPAARVSAAVRAFRQGKTDIVVGEGLGGFFEARIGSRREALRIEALNGVYGWRFNTVSGPLADPALRRALSARIDRAGLARSFGVPAIVPETGIIPVSMRGDAALIAPAPEPAARDAAIAEAPAPASEAPSSAMAPIRTVREPIVLRLLLRPGREHAAVAERVAVDWRPLGIVLTVQLVDANVASALIRKGDYDLALDETSFAVADPAALLDRFRCTRGGHCNAPADAALAVAITLPPDARLAALAQAEALQLEAPPFLPLFTAVRWALVSPTLYGWVSNSSGIHPLARIGRGRPER
jgi:oligopeptide transport system substrate-binding protein